jgi:alkylation response protein AidB-like acyl-CoA dehydrogenase
MADLFTLTEEHRTFREVVRRLAEDRIAPRAAEIDATAEFPWDVKEVLAENGLLGLHIPEEYSGAGADTLTFCILVEEVARVCASSSVIPLVQKLGSMPILMGASEEQKKTWLPAVATGEDLIAYCISEAGAGSDPASMVTTARRDGDDWVLNGTKMWTSMAGPAAAYSVLAKTDPEAGPRGVSAFYVRKDDAGFSVGKKEDKLGIRGSPTCQVHFDDCRIPADRLIGEEGKGFYLAMGAFDHTRLVVGAQAVGIAQGALDHAVAYVKERKQFGRAVGSFQALKHRLADLWLEINQAGAVARYAADAHSRQDEPAVAAALAQAYCGPVAVRAAEECVQLHGGIGMTWEYPAHLYLKRAKADAVALGGAHEHRARLGPMVGLPSAATTGEIA